jgi:hypothetical protein
MGWGGASVIERRRVYSDTGRWRPQFRNDSNGFGSELHASSDRAGFYRSPPSRRGATGRSFGIDMLATIWRHVTDDADGFERDKPLGDEFVDRRKKRIYLLLRIDDLDQDREIG